MDVVVSLAAQGRLHLALFLQIAPWLLIGIGIWWIVGTTILYKTLRRWFDRMIEAILQSQLIADMTDSSIVNARLISMAKAIITNESLYSFNRWVCLVGGVCFVGGGIAWLVIR